MSLDAMKFNATFVPLAEVERRIAEAVAKLRIELDAKQAECMEGHRAFEALFGESLRGRDFGVKFSMAQAAQTEAVALAKAEEREANLQICGLYVMAKDAAAAIRAREEANPKP